MNNTYARNKETHPLDIDLKGRNNVARLIVLGVYVVTIPLTFLIIGTFLGMAFFDTGLMGTMTTILATGLGLTLTIGGIGTMFVINNPTTGMFVTQDQLRSLRGLDDVNVFYGPGTHICFPWEKRLKGNNISLEEAANDLDFEVQCKDGILKGEGSYRMRPDMQNPVAFLTGVAAAADEIKDLFKADVVDFLEGKTVMEALSKLGELNDHLKKFRENHAKDDTDIEKRFGVQITDVTVSQLLPSEEVRKSISALTEAWAIQKGTELLLGIPEGEMNEWIKEKRITQADVKEDRKSVV